MPRGQQCVFDQAPGVLPVRRETIEGIDGGRMQCVHPAGAQRVTRCQVETSRNSHMAAGCNACIRLMCNGCQAEAWQHLQHAVLVVPGPFGRQRLQGPGGNIACCRWREMRLTVLN